MNIPSDHRQRRNSSTSLDGAYSWFVVGVLSLAAIVSYVDRQIINLLVEPIKASLGVSDTQISLVQGLSFALFYAVLSVPIARLADSGNRKQVIITGVVVWSLATFSCGLAIGFWSLFLARVFVGAGEATLAPAGYSMLGDYFSKERLPMAISVFTGSGFVGSGVALVIGAFVIDAVFGMGDLSLPVLGAVEPWQLIFMLVALPSVVLVLLLVMIQEPVRSDALKGDVGSEVVPMRGVFAHILSNKRIYIAIFFGFSLMASAQFSIGAWVPSFFIRTFEWSPSQIGVRFGIIASVFSTSGVIFGGWLSSRLWRSGVTGGNFIVPIAAALIGLPFAVAFPQMASPNSALILLCFLQSFGAMPFGAGTATLPQIAPNRIRAQVVAIYLLIANLIGFSLGPTSVAIVTDRVFADPNLLKHSLSIVAPTLMLLGAVVVASGLKSYRSVLKVD